MPEGPVINTVMIDCRDSHRLVQFWSGLLGVGVRYRLDQFAWLEPQRPGGYSLAFQEIDDPTPGKNRLHLDGECEDLEALTMLVQELGGRLVEVQNIPGFVWNVYADPESNLFCFGHGVDS